MSPDGPDQGELVAEQFERNGTFLDGACGDGRLMESVQVSAGRRGLRIEPYGLEADAGTAELARGRLPGWADRIWTGTLHEWTAPRRFDVVRVGLDPVPSRELVARVLADVVTPGGRLLLGPYAEDVESAGVAEAVRDWGAPVRRMLEAPDPASGRVARLLVVSAPRSASVTSLDAHRRRRSG